jgi:hypothetical protein
MCVDTGSSTRGCKGVSSKQWELGSLGVVRDVQVCAWVGSEGMPEGKSYEQYDVLQAKSHCWP